MATSLSAIAAGTTFGVFTLGMLIPWSNTKGAVCGMVAGAIMSGWISLGSQIAVASGHISPHKLGTWTDGCTNSSFNGTINLTSFTVPQYKDESNVFELYRLSFHWINPIGVLSVLIVGTIVSFITGPTKFKDIDPNLISPVIHR